VEVKKYPFPLPPVKKIGGGGINKQHGKMFQEVWLYFARNKIY
jgi:hypothetical protein